MTEYELPHQGSCFQAWSSTSGTILGGCGGDLGVQMN